MALVMVQLYVRVFFVLSSRSCSYMSSFCARIALEGQGRTGALDVFTTSQYPYLHPLHICVYVSSPLVSWYTGAPSFLHPLPLPFF